MQTATHLQEAVGGRHPEALPTKDAKTHQVEDDADDDDDEEDDTVGHVHEVEVVQDLLHTQPGVKVSV